MKSGYSIANLLQTEQRISLFQQITNYLFIALTNQPMLCLNCQPNQFSSQILQWLDGVSEGKSFEYANKISNKQEPEDNILWFSRESFHCLEAWLANEFQKSITKHYFKKDLLPSYKLKDFTEYMTSKHPHEAKFLKLSINQARRLSREEIQNYCNIIKSYENQYYEDVRKNFIESLEILQIDKQARKKRKNKRKGKKKTTSNPHNSDPSPEAEHTSQTKNCLSEKDKQSDIEDEYFLVPDQIKQSQQKQQKIQQKLSDQHLQHEDKNYKKNNNSEKGKTKKYICKKSTGSQETKCESSNQNKQNKNSSKNLVKNKQRSRSPFVKSNNFDKDLSKSTSSGEVYETFTQALMEDYNTKGEEFQLQNFSEHTSELKQHEQNIQNKKQRRKRKGNHNLKQVQQMARLGCNELINKQLTNFIDSLSIQTNNLYESKVISFERVRYFVKTLFPQTEAILFGSNSMGLSLPSSDVDIMLYNVPCRNKEEIKQMLAQIAIEINAMGWIVSCSTYLNAKVPLVKLEIDPLVSYLQTKRRSDYQNIYDPMIVHYLDIKDRKRAKNIFVDITINLEDTTYSPSTELMKSWVNSNLTLQRIIIVFKYILAEKEYNKNFIGGLGSYCLFIMITAYFKQFNESLPEDEGQIFLDILKFYSEEFENKLKSITLRENQSCFISLEQLLTIENFSESILSNPLRIIDPLTQKLTSSSCSQFHAIKTEFRRIRQDILAELEHIEKEIVTNFTPLHPSKVQLTQKSVDKWIHKYECRTKFSIKKIIDGN